MPVNTATETIEKLLDGVTAGPWWVRYNGGNLNLMMGDSCQMCDMTYYPWVPENEQDWHFIAASRELVPALLDERDAAVQAALDLAADIVDNHLDAWGDSIINGSSLDITRRAIRTITVADVLAKVGAE